MAEHRRRSGDRAWRALAVTAVLVLGACADDDDDAGPDTTDTTEAPDTTAGAAGEADGGTIYDTVPAGEKAVLDPVALGELGDFGDGVTTRVTDIESVAVEAFMPGEISGPGVAITVELTNGTSAPIDLGSVTVDLVATGDRYATLITTRDDSALSGELAPGATGAGTYVFTIADEDRDAVVVQVTYTAPKPTVVFEGSLADV